MVSQEHAPKGLRILFSFFFDPSCYFPNYAAGFTRRHRRYGAKGNIRTGRKPCRFRRRHRCGDSRGRSRCRGIMLMVPAIGQRNCAPPYSRMSRIGRRQFFGTPLIAGSADRDRCVLTHHRGVIRVFRILLETLGLLNSQRRPNRRRRRRRLPWRSFQRADGGAFQADRGI